MPGAGRHRRAGQALSRCLTPAWVFGFGEPGIRRRRKGTTRRGGSPGSSRKVRVAWLAGRYRRGALSRLAGASQAVYDPGSKKAPCRSLTADKFEVSHCFAPVAGERQLRPRSHGHGHAVHLFITLPAPYARARAAHESPGHMVAQLNVTVCDMPCSWLTRAYPPNALERSLRSEPLEVSRSYLLTALLNLRAKCAAVESAACPPSSCASSLLARTSPRL